MPGLRLWFINLRTQSPSFKDEYQGDKHQWGNAIHNHGPDLDADPTNEFQMLSFDAATNALSLSDGNTVTIPSGGTTNTSGLEALDQGEGSGWYLVGRNTTN